MTFSEVEELKADIVIARYEAEKRREKLAKETEGFAESFPKLKKTFTYKYCKNTGSL